MTNFIRSTLCAALAASALTLAAPVGADTNPGAYLAARQAGQDGDYPAAARYFRAALLADAGNTDLMEQTMTSFLGMGEVEQAATIAKTFIAAGEESQIANMALFAHAARTQNWDGIFDLLEAGHEVGPLVDGLGQAWAYVGNGQMDRAIMSFEEVIDTPGLRPFGQQHKAFALAMVGDLEGADAIYSLPPNEGMVPSRDSVMAHLRILAQLGDFERALGIFDRGFGQTVDPELVGIRTALAMQTIPEFEGFIATPTRGIGYTFLGLSEILQGEANESYILLYAQAARYISPGDSDAHIAAARLLNALGQFEQAAQTYADVDASAMAFHRAEVGRAESLRLAGRLDQAVEVLSQLVRSYPNHPIAMASLGDVYRQQENFAAANKAYDDALSAYSEQAPIRWWLLYTRGMTFERMDQWPEAEADFRAALALNPEEPSVLNYLGYSMVDRGISANYDEALAMIETAEAARPDSGAIVDSLAWVYYKLGRYQEAVGPMERAAELEPNDPVISDHLGDVYWMVGRDIEARFQWRRALSFEPEEAEADRIRRKLAIGLDAVYAEEGVTPAPAVEVASDDN